MRTPSSTIRATFHNASVTLKVRSSLVADISGSRTASTANLCKNACHKSFYGQPVFPLSTVVFKLDVSPLTIPLQSVLAHLTTALEQVTSPLTGFIQSNHAVSQNMTMLGLSGVVVLGSAEVTGISRHLQGGSSIYFASSTTYYFCKADARISTLP